MAMIQCCFLACCPASLSALDRARTSLCLILKPKSKEWENFGFAADENGNELDKKKIGYSGNKTNLTVTTYNEYTQLYTNRKRNRKQN